MAMGKRTSEQTPMGISATDFPILPGHSFSARVNAILDEARFAGEQCRADEGYHSKPEALGRGTPRGRQDRRVDRGALEIALEVLVDGLGLVATHICRLLRLTPSSPPSRGLACARAELRTFHCELRKAECYQHVFIAVDLQPSVLALPQLWCTGNAHE